LFKKKRVVHIKKICFQSELNLVPQVLQLSYYNPSTEHFCTVLKSIATLSLFAAEQKKFYINTTKDSYTDNAH